MLLDRGIGQFVFMFLSVGAIGCTQSECRVMDNF